MYKNAVRYKDRWLAPGSLAHTLHQSRFSTKDLDQHLKEVDRREAELSNRYKQGDTK